jgi:hypothetical protein
VLPQGRNCGVRVTEERVAECALHSRSSVRVSRRTIFLFLIFAIVSPVFSIREHIAGESVFCSPLSTVSSPSQVLFYKHVLAPRHKRILKAERLVFVLVGGRPNPRRWYGNGNLESDAEEFLRLVRPQYWPAPDIYILSYEELAVEYNPTQATWHCQFDRTDQDIARPWV